MYFILRMHVMDYAQYSIISERAFNVHGCFCRIPAFHPHPPNRHPPPPVRCKENILLKPYSGPNKIKMTKDNNKNVVRNRRAATLLTNYNSYYQIQLFAYNMYLKVTNSILCLLIFNQFLLLQRQESIPIRGNEYLRPFLFFAARFVTGQTQHILYVPHLLFVSFRFDMFIDIYDMFR